MSIIVCRDLTSGVIAKMELLLMSAHVLLTSRIITDKESYCQHWELLLMLDIVGFEIYRSQDYCSCIVAYVEDYLCQNILEVEDY